MRCDCILGTEDDNKNSHLLFTLHVYQYRVDKTKDGPLEGQYVGLTLIYAKNLIVIICHWFKSAEFCAENVFLQLLWKSKSDHDIILLRVFLRGIIVILFLSSR